MNPPRMEPLELLQVEDAPVTRVSGPERLGEEIRRANRERARRSRANRKERAERPAYAIATLPEYKPSKPISPDLAAWVARKRRERAGLPLRQCDREQITAQLEDMGGM